MTRQDLWKIVSSKKGSVIKYDRYKGQDGYFVLKAKEVNIDKLKRMEDDVTDMSLCECFGITNHHFRYLSDIIRMNLSHTAITGEGFQYLTSLRTFILRKCTNLVEVHFQYLSKITSIDLSQTRITGKGFQYLTSLRSILLQDCSFDGNNLVYLKHISDIDITGCNQISDDHLIHVRLVKNITLGNCCQITDEGIQYLTKVTCMHITDCPYISGKLLSNTVKKIQIHGGYMVDILSFRYIQIVMLSSLQITDREIQKMSLSTLKHLHITNCPNIMGICFEKFTRIMVTLIKCRNITNDGLKTMSTICSLTLVGCSKITNQGIQFLIYVGVLKVVSCHLITNECLSMVAKLTYVSFFDCKHVDDIIIKN